MTSDEQLIMLIKTKYNPSSGYMQWNRMMARRNKIPADKFWQGGV